MAPIVHGTTYRYRRGCRCDSCRAAQTRAMRDYRSTPRPPTVDYRSELADVLNDLFPDGLTDDCPARRGMRA
jgi:hypothetical protein